MQRPRVSSGDDIQRTLVPTLSIGGLANPGRRGGVAVVHAPVMRIARLGSGGRRIPSAGRGTCATGGRADDELCLRSAYTNAAVRCTAFGVVRKAVKATGNLVAGTGFEPVTFRL